MDDTKLRRREFLARTAAAAGLAGLSSLPAGTLIAEAARAQATGLPSPRNLPLDHVVVVMMENRSFDHYFGWLDGADGSQDETYAAPTGEQVATRHASSLEAQWQGCGHPDPGHGWEAGREPAAGRLPRRRQRQRRVRAHLLRRGRDRVPPRRRRRVHRLRPLLLLAARADLAEPLLQVVGAVRRAQGQHAAARDRRQPVGDDLRPRDRPRPVRPLLQLGPAVLRRLGRARRHVDAAARRVLRGLRARHAAEHHLRRPAVPRRRGRRRHLGRRAPARRRPARPGVDGRRRARLRAVAVLPPRRAVRRLRRVGRLLRPRAPAARARRPRRRRPGRGLRPDGLPHPGRGDLAVRAAAAPCATRSSASSRSSS